MSLTALFPALTAPITSTDGDTLSPSDDFEVLALALGAADLTTTVAGLEDVTVFAPTDAAFADLAGSLGYEGDPSDSDAVFGAIATALAGLDPDGDPIPLLTDILLYHVAPGEQAQADLAGSGPVDTLLADTTFQVTGTLWSITTRTWPMRTSSLLILIQARTLCRSSIRCCCQLIRQRRVLIQP